MAVLTFLLLEALSDVGNREKLTTMRLKYLVATVIMLSIGLLGSMQALSVQGHGLRHGEIGGALASVQALPSQSTPQHESLPDHCHAVSLVCQGSSVAGPQQVQAIDGRFLDKASFGLPADDQPGAPGLVDFDTPPPRFST